MLSGSASPPALMFNSGMFSPTSMGSVTPPTTHSVNNSPTPGGVSPPMFSSYNPSGNFSPFLARPSYPNPNTYHPTTTSQSFQKFDPNVSKYEGSVSILNGSWKNSNSSSFPINVVNSLIFPVMVAECAMFLLYSPSICSS